MRFRIVIFLGLLSTYGFGQEFFAAPNQAMGNSGIAVPSVYSLSLNAAALGKLNGATVALAYQPHLLSTSIQSQALYFALPFQSSNTVAFGINNYGLKGVSSLMTVRATYCKSFGEMISSSVSTNYHQYQVKNYGSDRTFSIDLGIHFSLHSNLSLGAFYRNISAEKFEDTIDQNILQEAGIGMAYTLSKELLIVTDLFYNDTKKMDPRFGLAYTMNNLLILRVGAIAKPLQYTGGIGLCLNKLFLDLSASFNSKVGYAPQLALTYGF